MPRLGMNLIIIGYHKNDEYKLICEEFENYNEMSNCLNLKKEICYRLTSAKQSYKSIIYEVVDLLGKEERERQKQEWILNHSQQQKQSNQISI